MNKRLFTYNRLTVAKDMSIKKIHFHLGNNLVYLRSKLIKYMFEHFKNKLRIIILKQNLELFLSK